MGNALPAIPLNVGVLILRHHFVAALMAKGLTFDEATDLIDKLVHESKENI